MSPPDAPAGGRPAADPGRHYITRQQLADQVRAYQRDGRATDELAHSLLLIAGGVWDRYQRVWYPLWSPLTREDWQSEAVLHLLGSPLRRCDPRRNVFSFLTTCLIRLGGKLCDRECGRARREQRYRELVTEAYQRATRRHSRTIRPPAEEE
jgi:hypothetical protein